MSVSPYLNLGPSMNNRYRTLSRDCDDDDDDFDQDNINLTLLRDYESLI
jgi:hypothetical protein